MWQHSLCTYIFNRIFMFIKGFSSHCPVEAFHCSAVLKSHLIMKWGIISGRKAWSKARASFWLLHRLYHASTEEGLERPLGAAAGCCWEGATMTKASMGPRGAGMPKVGFQHPLVWFPWHLVKCMCLNRMSLLRKLFRNFLSLRAPWKLATWAQNPGGKRVGGR